MPGNRARGGERLRVHGVLSCGLARPTRGRFATAASQRASAERFCLKYLSRKLQPRKAPVCLATSKLTKFRRELVNCRYRFND